MSTFERQSECMAGLKVLIVDDARFIRDLVSKIVSSGFPNSEVKAAEDGDAGRKMMMQHQFDIILCDWEMPGLSGLEVLQWARQQPNYQKVPFLMVTSRGERDYVLKAVQSGVNDYIGKPFEPSHLIDKIKTWLAKGGETSSVARRRAAEMLAAEQKTQKPAPKKPKGLAQLRLGGGVHRCAVKDLTLQQVRVAVKREDVIPAMLEPTVVDIEQADGSTVQLNGFVRAIEAHEPKVDSAFLNVDVLFVDNDPEKMALLSRYIERMNKSTG